MTKKTITVNRVEPLCHADNNKPSNDTRGYNIIYTWASPLDRRAAGQRAPCARTHFPYIHNGGLLRLASTQYGYFNPLLTSRTFVGHFLLWLWWVGLNGSVYNTSIDCYEWHSKSSPPRWSMERSSFPFASPRRRSSKAGTLERSRDHRGRLVLLYHELIQSIFVL